MVSCNSGILEEIWQKDNWISLAAVSFSTLISRIPTFGSAVLSRLFGSGGQISLLSNRDSIYIRPTSLTMHTAHSTVVRGIFPTIFVHHFHLINERKKRSWKLLTYSKYRDIFLNWHYLTLNLLELLILVFITIHF